MIRLLVGLGNPGPEYEMTRHNAGFWFIDEVARKFGTALQPERSYFGLVARVNRPEGPIWLLEPMTFMNLSGKAVAALARFFKIAPSEILVAHDELDLMPGQVKMKLGGSHAGHNGLKDIQAQLGSADFWRLRLGIGHPGVKAEVINHVLRKPPLTEREAIDKSIEQGMTALDLLLAGEMERAMVKIHAKPPRPKPLPQIAKIETQAARKQTSALKTELLAPTEEGRASAGDTHAPDEGHRLPASASAAAADADGDADADAAAAAAAAADADADAKQPVQGGLSGEQP